MALNDNIKLLREKKSLTQQQLADILYVSRQTVCRWENASRCPDLITAKKLAMEFDVSLDELISDEDLKNFDDKLSFRQPVKFRKRRKLQEFQVKVLNFIEIMSTIYLLSSVFIVTWLDIKVPLWCFIIGICTIGTALVINIIILKKMEHL